MSLVSKMKSDISKSGSSKGKLLFVGADTKVRIRFLVDLEAAKEVVVHDSFKDGINTMCLEQVGKDCPLCGNDSLRTRTNYAWPVYDYEAKEVKIMMYAANKATPVNAFISMFETYGTILDRDYVISRTGKALRTNYQAIPMDKAKFKIKDAKPFPPKKMMRLISQALPLESGDYADDDDVDVEEGEVTSTDYSKMSAKELYKLCTAKDIDVEPRKSKDYYIEELEEDSGDDDWDDEDDDDDDDW